MTAIADPAFLNPWGLSRLQLAQRKELLCALIETNGNQTTAADSLGISRPTMRAWINDYHIHKAEWEMARAYWGIETTKPGAVLWRTFYVIQKQ